MTEAEISFEVSSPPEDAWKLLEELRAGRTQPDAEPPEWWLPGFDCVCTEVDSEPHRRLTVRKSVQPCAGTLIAVTFEHAGTGSRIRVVQSGFDEAFVKAAGEAFWTHAGQIFADVQLYFERGVLGHRAWRPFAPLGLTVVTTAFGVEVDEIFPGTWAARIGLEPGDILLTVANASLYAQRDLVTVARVVASGDDIAATWARSGERLEATSVL